MSTKEETFQALRDIIDNISTEHTIKSNDWWHSYGTVRLPTQYDYLYYPLFYLKYDIFTWGDLVKFLDTHSPNDELCLHGFISRDEFGKHKLKEKYGITDTDPIVKVSTRNQYQTINNPFNLPVTVTRKHHDTILNGFTYEFVILESYTFEVNGPDWLTRVNEYRFVPRDLKFLGGNKSSKMFFGLELEISTKLSPAELYYVATQVEPKQEPFFYCKHDGSIEGRYGMGFEIVTLPCTPRYLKNAFRVFNKKLEKLTGGKLGDYIDLNDPSSTGLHIHVSKNSFRHNSSYERLWMNKFSTIWNQWDTQNNEFLTKLSRRKTSLTQMFYCKPHKQMLGKSVAQRLSNGAFCDSHDDRYSSARETDNTVEVRVFQGRFDTDHISYCIELTQAIHEYSRQMSIKDIGRNFKSSFTSWLGSQSGYRHAKQGVFQCV